MNKRVSNQQTTNNGCSSVARVQASDGNVREMDERVVVVVDRSAATNRYESTKQINRLRVIFSVDAPNESSRSFCLMLNFFNGFDSFIHCLIYSLTQSNEAAAAEKFKKVADA